MGNISTQTGALRVMELFAGVGGFHQGLQAVNDVQEGPCFDVVWSALIGPGAANRAEETQIGSLWQSGMRRYEGRLLNGALCPLWSVVMGDVIDIGEMHVGQIAARTLSRLRE